MTPGGAHAELTEDSLVDLSVAVRMREAWATALRTLHRQPHVTLKGFLLSQVSDPILAMATAPPRMATLEDWRRVLPKKRVRR